MRLTFTFALLFFVLICTAQTNVGVGIAIPTNRLHVVNTADPLRLEGVVSGLATDSILTINATGVVKRRSVVSLFSGGPGWLLAGNILANNTGTSFLGSVNATSLFFRTNNLRSGFIDFDSSKRNNSFGNRALGLFTTGIANNAFGYQALRSLTTGNNNVAFGDSAGFTLTGGNDNVTIGTNAGLLLGTGVQNVAIGSRSLAASSAANDNIAIGHRTLELNDASANIAIGSQALNANTFGSNNIGIGTNALALSSNVSNFNIAIGNSALAGATTSTEQIALGYNTGLSLTTGSYNTLLGHYNFSAATGGTYNTMVGYQTGANMNLAASSNNTFLGALAGLNQIATGAQNTAGSNDTYIGYQAGPTTQANFSNSSALGSGAPVTNNNLVRLGNNSVTAINGAVNFVATSDARVKINVQENVGGLSFISLLRPVTFNFDVQKMNDIQNVPLAARTSYAEKQKIRYSGFLAQEVEIAAQKAGYDFSGVVKPQNEHSLYGISYAEMVVPLVKAVQELKEMMEKQQQEIERLKAEIRGQKTGNN